MAASELARRLDDVETDPMWMRPCLAYNLQVALDAVSSQRLWQLVSVLAQSEPALLTCPPTTYHVSVLNVLPVRDPDLQAKAARWASQGARWQACAATAVARHAPYDIRLGALIATRSAVVAVAAASEPTIRLRESLVQALGLDLEPIPELTHVTVARYGGKPRDPDRLLARIDATALDIGVRVDRLRFVREDVYPSIQVEVVADLALGTHRGHHHA